MSLSTERDRMATTSGYSRCVARSVNRLVERVVGILMPLWGAGPLPARSDHGAGLAFTKLRAAAAS
jgi:hypothetical protein